MNDLWLLAAIPASAVVFYIFIPAIGVFQVRHRWRRFRARVVHAVSLPRLDAETVRSLLQGEAPARDGEYWFRGRLESLGINDTVWIERDGLTVSADICNTDVVLLPTPVSIGDDLPDETPQTVPWRELTALVEGTRFFLSGGVTVTDGSVQFVTNREHQPFVVVYDGPDDTLTARALWTGRQRNEYWNHLTPISLIGGFLALLLLGIAVLDRSRLMSLAAAVLATVPILPLLPPGVAGFYVYRRLWRRARRIRARRDLIGLPEMVNADSSSTSYRRAESPADPPAGVPESDRIITVRSGRMLARGDSESWEVWNPRGHAQEILPTIRRPEFSTRDISVMNAHAYSMEFGAILVFFVGLAINAYLAAVMIVLVLR